jgi:hypothetical protein
MLADFSDGHVQIGSLGKDVDLSATSLDELIDFIAGELPRRRDHPDRSTKLAETALTSQLCGHLNTVTRHSSGRDILQFRIEEPDEQKAGARDRSNRVAMRADDMDRGATLYPVRYFASY